MKTSNMINFSDDVEADEILADTITADKITVKNLETSGQTINVGGGNEIGSYGSAIGLNITSTNTKGVINYHLFSSASRFNTGSEIIPTSPYPHRNPDSHGRYKLWSGLLRDNVTEIQSTSFVDKDGSTKHMVYSKIENNENLAGNTFMVIVAGAYIGLHAKTALTNAKIQLFEKPEGYEETPPPFSSFAMYEQDFGDIPAQEVFDETATKHERAYGNIYMQYNSEYWVCWVSDTPFTAWGDVGEWTGNIEPIWSISRMLDMNRTMIVPDITKITDKIISFKLGLVDQLEITRLQTWDGGIRGNIPKHYLNIYSPDVSVLKVDPYGEHKKIIGV